MTAAQDGRAACRARRGRRVADAVLFEGYLLYPYRASAQKNRLRWQFGVLTPPGFPDEPDRSRTEVLLERRPGAVLHLRLRFLQLRARSVHDTERPPRRRAGRRRRPALPLGGGRAAGGRRRAPRRRAGRSHTVPFALPAEHDVEPVTGGRVERRCLPLNGRLVVAAEPLPGPYDVLRLRIDVVNDSACPDGAPREVALRTSLIAAHTLVAVTAGAFLSATDPPEWALPATRELDNRHTWPVLAGPDGRTDLLLSSADHPRRPPAARSGEPDGPVRRHRDRRDPQPAHAGAHRRGEGGGAGDGPARGRGRRRRGRHAARDLGAPARGDPHRCAAGVAGDPRTTSSAPGTTRCSRRTCRGGIPAPTPPSIPRPTPSSSAARRSPRAAGCCCGPRPGGDAQDLFLAGLPATVHAVLHDVDGEVHVAVSVDDDPAAELQVAHGRFRYFHPDEIEVVP